MSVSPPPAATAAIPRDRTAPPPTAGVLLVVGFVLVSLNTRVSFGQIGPLAPVAGFSPAIVSLLGLLPPLCMGAFAPLAAVIRRLLGEERGLWWASVVLVAGAVLRMLGLPGLLAGTVVVSAATAVVNVLIPVLVRKRFPRERVGTMMGVYALAMGAGSALVAAVVAPVAQATGNWQAAIGLAVIPAVLAAAGMTPQLPHRPPLAVAETSYSGTEPTGRPHVARTALAWSLTAFFGIQTLAFYTTLAWLPSVLVQAGLSRGAAGAGQALLICGVAAGGFIAPVLAARRADQRPHILATILVCAIGFTGLLLAPAGTSMVWVVILGIGLGSGQALPGVLYSHRGHDHDHVAALSTMAQTCGFLLAATGPVLAAALHTATGTWTAPLTGLTAALLVCAATSLRAGHDPT
ncbi:CP family cyanate transporter-like MFS transporter [Streptomyces sp. DSM 42143]|uniref:MFS transporter n=1 Tax=Streptomyces sp. DSM 42143 TaxID=2817711 RepID=UPI0027831CD9|nr:MFS transporter [Streptomyces sp. DSM 42143]MDQ0383195.1 CP family cyanate transporter-like MFS transporter [Streptomyces sp. DSM 42143]